MRSTSCTRSAACPPSANRLKTFLHLDCKSVSGDTLGEVLRKAPNEPNDVIRSPENPVSKQGGLAVLKGNLALNGAIVRASSVKAAMYHFKGPARVFDSDMEGFQAILDGKIKPGDVMVIRYCGPVGAPGMIE